MKSALLLITFFLITNISYGQIPSGWIGNWEGDLAIHTQPGDKNQVIDMKLSIQHSPRAGVTLWGIFYDDNNGGSWRNYELIEVDAKEGHYIMDELNSIKLDMFYFNNVFYSIFSVGKALITVRYELKDDIILFEITSANNDGEITGGEGDIPGVTNYAVRTIQKAILTRQN